MREELIILGHDPGASGAFALMTGSGKLLSVLDTPVLYMGRKTMFYTAHFCEWYAKTTMPYADCKEMAIVEAVGAMPRQGVSSMFNFGSMYGGASSFLMGMLGMENVWFETPAKWKSAMGLTKEKTLSLQIATEVFGEEVRDHYWRRKKDNGRAEAALLCHYYLKHIVKGED